MLQNPKLPQLPPLVSTRVCQCDFKFTPFSFYHQNLGKNEALARLKTSSLSDKVEGYIHLADSSSHGNSYVCSFKRGLEMTRTRTALVHFWSYTPM